MDTRVYDMLHHVLEKLDRIINGDSNINYRIQCDALARENAQLRAQLEERNKEFDRLYDVMEKMSNAMVIHNERMKNVEIAVGARKE